MPKVQFPVQRLVAKAMDRALDNSAKTVGPLSVGSWWLIAVTFASFFQWYAVGWAIGRLLDWFYRAVARRGAA